MEMVLIIGMMAVSVLVRIYFVFLVNLRAKSVCVLGYGGGPGGPGGYGNGGNRGYNQGYNQGGGGGGGGGYGGNGYDSNGYGKDLQRINLRFNSVFGTPRLTFFFFPCLFCSR